MTAHVGARLLWSPGNSYVEQLEGYRSLQGRRFAVRAEDPVITNVGKIVSFYNNCCKTGLLPIVLTEAEVDRLFDAVKAFPGFKLVIDLERQSVATPDGAMACRFDIDEFRKHRLINGLDDIGLTLQHADAIREFEAKHLADQPWLA